MDVFTLESTPEWDAWFGKLRDRMGKRAILTRLARLQITGHWGDAEPVGEGVTEMRVHAGPGYRIYCKQTGKTIILLLNGGNKDSQAATFVAPRRLLAMPKRARYPKFDIAEHLDTPEIVAGFISDAFDTGDAAYIAGALGIAARARGMTTVAANAGLSREQLYRSLSNNGNPKLTTVIATLRALDLHLHATPARTSRSRRRQHAANAS